MGVVKFRPSEGSTITELQCGKHDKHGRFRPKNIKLTSIARLRHAKDSSYDSTYDWINPRIPMIGYSKDERQIYQQMMQEKKESKC